MPAELRLPSDYEAEVVLNWKQLIVFIFFLSFVFVYIFSYIADKWFSLNNTFSDFHIIVGLIVDIIMSDWQLLLAVAGIILITLGWYLIQFFSVLIIHSKVKIGLKIKKKRSFLVRYAIGEYFFSLLIAYMIFSYNFTEPMLWFSAIFVFALFYSITVGLYSLWEKREKNPEKLMKKIKEVIPKEEERDPELKNKSILILSLVVIFLLSLVVLWEAYVGIWDLIHSDLVITIYFYFAINITILWWFWRFIGVILTYITNYFVKEIVRKKVNKLRFVIFVFIVSMLLYRLLPYYALKLDLTQFQIQMIAFFLSILTSILSMYLTRKFFRISP